MPVSLEIETRQSFPAEVMAMAFPPDARSRWNP